MTPFIKHISFDANIQMCTCVCLAALLVNVQTLSSELQLAQTLYIANQASNAATNNDGYPYLEKS